jgi:uncharacterized protein (DUF1778 family)
MRPAYNRKIIRKTFMARFKKLSDEVRKKVPILIRVSRSDAETIRRSASNRSMSVPDFVRRAALSRPADLDYENQIVLKLGEVVRCLRELNTTMVKLEIPPPHEIWEPVFDLAIQAMRDCKQIN